jgi:hypothetical protein
MKSISKLLLLSIVSTNIFATNTELIVCSVKNIENANTFIDKYLNKSKRINIYKYHNRFLISYGKFNSKKEAKASIKNLSKDIQKLQPYPKEMDQNLIVTTNNTIKRKYSNIFYTTKYFPKINYDAGIGINYGGLYGLSLSTNITNNIELYASLGDTTVAGTSYSIGARYYMNNNIRYTISHGINNIIKFTDPTLKTEKYTGTNIGIGYANSSGGWSADLMYVLTSNIDNRLDELRKAGNQINEETKFRLNIGYRF